MKEKFQINEEVLWDYADGLLPAAEAQSVRNALADSADVQRLYAQVQAEKALLRAAPSDVPPIDFSKNIMAAWTAEQEQVILGKAKTDRVTKAIFGFLGGSFCLAIVLFFYALIQQSGLEVNLFEYTNTNTDWASHPSYLLSMFLIALLASILALERGFDRGSWARA